MKRIETPTTKVLNVAVTEDTLTVELDDGRSVSVPVAWFPRLVYGTQEERNPEASHARQNKLWITLRNSKGVKCL